MSIDEAIEIQKVPALPQNGVLAKEIRNLKIKKVKYMRPILLSNKEGQK